MRSYDQHISLKTIALLVAMTLILPSVVKFSHALANHEHEVCIEKHQTHLHSVDFDCQFYKFKIQKQSIVLPSNYELIEPEDNHGIVLTYYAFLSDYQRLAFTLRGPPINN